jgi:hypothetical protein
MGFTGEHVPELIRMATDLDLADSEEDTAEMYGGIHAWRTLGLLRAEAAIGPLIELLGDTDDDWVQDEFPDVMGMIGPAAIEPLRAALARWALEGTWDAAFAARGLLEIARRFPETRDAVVAALTRQLRWWARHDPNLNSMLVHDLVELKAAEAAPVMEEAFAAGAVDTLWTDDWEDVQVALGLLPERITPKPPYVPPAWLSSTPFIRRVAPDPAAASNPAAAAKRRKKAGKAARRRKGKRR